MDAESRRKFLKQFVAAMGAAMGYGALGAVPRLARIEAALAADPTDVLSSRRHLITVLPNKDSGIDAHSFHMSFNPAAMNAANRAIHPYNTWDPDRGTFPVKSDAVTAPDAWSNRAVSNSLGTADHFCHPNYAPGDNVFLGPGMSIFQGTGLLENEIMIWGGARWKDGGHGIGTEVLSCGQRSRYAIGFGSHIAKHLGQKNPLALHYVHLAQSNSLATHIGMLGGLAEPIAIPDQATWQGLTVPKPYSLPVSDRALLEASVARLGTLGDSKLGLKHSKETFGDYLAAFRATGLIGGSGWGAAGSPFDQIWQGYRTAVKAEIEAHPYWKRYTELKATTAFPSYEDAGPGDVVLNLDKITFRFALTEFLVGENLSAVVDLPGMMSDAHRENESECIGLLATFSCIKRLLLNLKSYTSRLRPEVGALNVLSRTTLAMYAEFDRQAAYSHNGAVSNKPGTDHGSTGSVFMAGMGVRRGKVVGGLKHQTSAYDDYTGGVAGALPVDLSPGANFGRPLVSGKLLYFEGFFPTMLKIFGVPVPQRQVTADSALDALINLSDIA